MVGVRDKKGNWCDCYVSCHRKDPHNPDKGECRRKEHMLVPIDPNFQKKPTKKVVKKSPEDESWKNSKFEAPTEAPVETQQEEQRGLTPHEEQILKMAHDIAEKKKEESRKLSEAWKTSEEIKEEKQTRKISPESASSEQRNTGNRKIKKGRFKMIRVREVVLTPAPGWNEAEGRPIQRGRMT